MRDGVEPRIHGVRSRWLALTPSLGFLIMRIPASMAAPHRVRFKNSGRFFSRNSRGKYEMDTHELRQAFTASEQLPAKFRTLHAAAVSAAKGNDMPFALVPEPAAIVSILPLGLFRESRDLDLTSERALAPCSATGAPNYMYTLEGMLLHAPISATNTVASYALTHREGRADAAWTIGRTMDVDDGRPRKLVWHKRFQTGLLETLRDSCRKLGSFGIEGPWVILVSVTGIADHRLILPYDNFSAPAWRDAATLPDAIIELPSEASLKPLLDGFWRLFGEPRPEAAPSG